MSQNTNATKREDRESIIARCMNAHKRETSMLEKSGVMEKTPDWAIEETISFLTSTESAKDLIKLVKSKYADLPSEAVDLFGFKTSNLALQRALQCWNELLISKKQSMFKVFSDSGEGDKEKYEGLKALIGEVQNSLTILFASHKMANDVLAVEREKKADSCSFTLADLAECHASSRRRNKTAE